VVQHELIDTQARDLKAGRVLRYLRISVTDACSFACLYCSPRDASAASVPLLLPADIERLVRVAGRLGVTHVRLTGGEPLERADIVEIVGRIADTGVPDISLTTNGVGLAELARPLARAGLHRVNISLPHLEGEGFERLTGGNAFPEVLAGIEAAKAAGLSPIKTNTVVVRGHNDDAVCELTAFALEEGLLPRFIEYMPSDEDDALLFVSAAQVLGRLERHFGIVGPLGCKGNGGGPARYYRLGGGGIVGIIPAVSEPFCMACNRLRVTAAGKLRPCLYAEDEIDLLAALSGGGADGLLERLLGDAMTMKPSVHGPRLPQLMRRTGG